MSQHHDRIKNDPRWKAARSACLDRDGYACVRCEATENLEADHIEELHSHPELAFELENLQTLCPSCHTDKAKEKQTIIRNTWISPSYPELHSLPIL